VFLTEAVASARRPYLETPLHKQHVIEGRAGFGYNGSDEDVGSCLTMRPQSQLLLLARVNLVQSWRRLRFLHKTSRILTLTIVVFIVGYLSLSFFLFSRGLHFVNDFPALGALLLERLLYLLFASLLVLLIFSNLIIGYGNFFGNRETNFLLPLPIPAQTIFRWKFIESTLLASWAFLFLIAPLLAAYGLTLVVPWHFYLMTVVAIALFIVLPGVAGAWVALGLARLLDRRTFQVLAVIAALLLLPLLRVWLRPEVLPDDPMDTRVLSNLDKLLNHTRFAESPWLPSYWLSISVIQWSEGALSAALFFLLVLLSHVLFFGCLCFTCTGRLFFDSLSAVQSRDSVFHRWEWFQRWRSANRAFDYPVGPMERAFRLAFNPPPDVLAMLVKDARCFWRDTAQWSQTLILMGLLAVYIINLRNFSDQLSNPFWVHLVCYLNLGACALNLATLTTRFVYPQFSLEGKRLWIIGMAPLGLVQILRVKFWIASRAALLLTLPIILLSCNMLRISLDRTLYLSLIIATMTFTLTALATGLSALFPNFREDNPAKIVSGFGGTLCLLLSFLYIVGSVTLLAIGSPWGWRGETSVPWILGSWVGFAFLSAVVGLVPFRLGLRRVEGFEF
jgi:ABC-2 type transport system permease protein